jgi:hypothetical protein
MKEKDEGVEALKKMSPEQLAFLITKYWRKPHERAVILLHEIMDKKDDNIDLYVDFISLSRGYWDSELADKVKAEMQDRINNMRSKKKKEII